MKLAPAAALMLLTCSLAIEVAATEPDKAQSRNNDAQPAGTSSDSEAVRGQRLFNQNCSRCHDAPSTLPPAISTQIIRHMRVRASLPASDEKALLRFINPE